MSTTGPTPDTTDPGVPLSVDEMLDRAELHAIGADVLAAQFQGTGTASNDFAVHWGVLHEATLSQAWTALAQARMRRTVEMVDEEEQVRQADPRAALREQAAQIQVDLRNRAPGRYVR